LLRVGYLIGIVRAIEVNGLNLRVELHKDGLHPVGHRVTGVVEVVEVLAERPVVKTNKT
jgi:hypothetical protein